MHPICMAGTGECAQAAFLTLTHWMVICITFPKDLTHKLSTSLKFILVEGGKSRRIKRATAELAVFLN